MATEITIVRGPSSTRLTKEAAATELQKMPGYPENATYTIDEVDGRWVAAVVWQKEAGPFPPAAGGDDEAPSGPPEGLSEGPPSDDGSPSDEGEKPKEDKGEDGDKPSSEGAPKEEGKLSVEHQLANLTDMLTKITDALGLSTPADGMIPGADDGAVPPPDGPPGPDGLPGGPPGPEDAGASPDKHQTIRHERSMKPGEAPPGTTPVSAPSFASVSDDHPWKAAIEAGAKEFEVESPIGDTPLSAVAATLKELAEPYGLIVTDLAPSGYGTERTASARIVRTR